MADRRALRPPTPAAGQAAADDGDWPAHPWIGLVERFGPAPPPATRAKVIVIWWPTRAGPQPVLLVRRQRPH